MSWVSEVDDLAVRWAGGQLEVKKRAKKQKDCTAGLEPTPCLQLCSDSAQKSARGEVNRVATQSRTRGRMMLDPKQHSLLLIFGSKFFLRCKSMSSTDYVFELAHPQILLRQSGPNLTKGAFSTIKTHVYNTFFVKQASKTKLF